ncbi:type II toxin-antitoxin system prevent-host-death family antitoxin [Caballeronia sp. LZ025]|uniref:type II toxin-antitoxin system Phd/YefM family antitoxin n=1 Tax=Caballeronia TaxID=1827195 RepID=UPI001FD0F82E|nr:MULTISPECIES: type II toxin-antitoxin system prevent-host-death family antitoxin [Caballeronia]MDR5735997.1 type II toxin-antitoxin system prevent-host-death family antitoxin [Caballeronia sp. LZ025]
MQTVNIHEAKSQLSRLIEAAVSGEEVVIAKAGTPVVRLVSVEQKPKLRLGLMKGKIKIADDFDAPLPDEVLATFEGR